MIIIINELALYEGYLQVCMHQVCMHQICFYSMLHILQVDMSLKKWRCLLFGGCPRKYPGMLKKDSSDAISDNIRANVLSVSEALK